MVLEWVVLEVLAVALLSATTSDDGCYGAQARLARHLSTKTPYGYVGHTDTTVDPAGGECSSSTPRQVWFISRHGTRFPSRKGLELILQRLPEMAEEVRRSREEEGRGALCEATVGRLLSWAPRARLEDTKTLHPEGEMEMLLMAERFQSRFPRLLGHYHAEDFTFRATASQRSFRSMFYFASGLFGRDVAQSEVRFQRPVEPHDPLIRFYKVCRRWQKDVKHHSDSVRERSLFESSDFFRKELLSPLSRRLGYADVISLDDLDAIYNGCVFGQAWSPKSPSPWCQVFTEEELSIMEYREDLEYYWQSGYGFDVNHEQACVLARDIWENFQNVTQGRDGEEAGIFYFSHSGAILKFLSYLGLFRDSEPLRHDNYERMLEGRRWRTSLFNSFASNVAFVLQECGGDGGAKGQHKVGLFVNERLTLIPGCADVWCDINTFSQIFEKSRDCILEDVCSLDDEDDDAEDVEETDEDKF